MAEKLQQVTILILSQIVDLDCDESHHLGGSFEVPCQCQRVVGIVHELCVVTFQWGILTEITFHQFSSALFAGDIPSRKLLPCLHDGLHEQGIRCHLMHV